MGLDQDYVEGQTSLDDDEREGLLIESISTRRELDEFEQLGVEKALEWSMKRKPDVREILTEDFVKVLHKRMFSEVWRWAGQFRTSNKNFGVDKGEIHIEVRKLLDDCMYWVDNAVFPPDEIAVRLSHRIVSIHPFANGNGRHSRLIADVLAVHGFGKMHFTWGSKNLVKKGAARAAYLEALKKADVQSYSLLIKFARQ